MGDRFPGGVISKTPPEVTPPASSGSFAGEGGAASGLWSLAEQLDLEKAGFWPKRVLPRELYAWGGNNVGQLGDNTTANKSSPVQVGLLVNWAQVSGGAQGLTASVTTNKFLYLWGNNNFGQLGDNTTTNKSSPVQVGALTNWEQVAAGTYHAAAVKTDGTIWAWGGNSNASFSPGAVGDNTVVNRSSPVQIGALTNWFQVSAQTHTSAVKTDGTLWSWGYNGNGQLGDNTTANKSSPVQIGALTNWAQVSASYHTSAITTSGQLYAWGYNGRGQVGDNTIASKSSPVQIGALTNWAQVAGGNFHTVSVKTDGTLWSWGFNNNGQLGQNDLVNRSSPVQIGALTNWAQVAAGSQHTVAVKADGTLWAWGDNGSGQGGDNTTANKSSPVQVGALLNWAQASAGSFHTTALLKGT
jgi:alpha-tubulin suppressor-like RCC1 family protein